MTSRSLNNPGSKILYHPEQLAAYRHGIAYPTAVEIDLTWRCALNCKGCHSKHLHSGVELNEEQIYMIVAKLYQKGLKAVTWSGGGDPLESPHWRSAMEYAAALGLDQGLYSYLPGLDQEVVDFLEQKVKFVYTHSCSPRGLRRKTFGPRFTYGFLVDSTNWYKIESFARGVDLNFFDFVDFRPLCPENTQTATPAEDYSWISPCLLMLARMSARNPQVKYAEYKFMDLLRKDFGRTYSTCYSTDFTTAIGPNGDVYECINRRGFADSVLGNLLAEDLEAIWKRKARCRTDLSACRILCRNHEENKVLFKILDTSQTPEHLNFI